MCVCVCVCVEGGREVNLSREEPAVVHIGRGLSHEAEVSRRVDSTLHHPQPLGLIQLFRIASQIHCRQKWACVCVCVCACVCEAVAQPQVSISVRVHEIC